MWSGNLVCFVLLRQQDIFPYNLYLPFMFTLAMPVPYLLSLSYVNASLHLRSRGRGSMKMLGTHATGLLVVGFFVSL